MASELKVDKITGVATAGSIDVTGEGGSTNTNLPQGLTKGWINFNDGSEADTVRDSFNVTTLTDRGTGLWTLTVTNNFVNIYYEGSGSAADAWPDADARNRMVLNGPNTTSEVYINVFDTSGSTENDPDYVGASNHGDLA